MLKPACQAVRGWRRHERSGWPRWRSSAARRPRHSSPAHWACGPRRSWRCCSPCLSRLSAQPVTGGLGGLERLFSKPRLIALHMPKRYERRAVASACREEQKSILSAQHSRHDPCHLPCASYCCQWRAYPGLPAMRTDLQHLQPLT